MRRDNHLALDAGAGDATDPRDGAEVIALATRRVLPAVSQRKPGSERMGLMAGAAFVALAGALTLWGMNAARHSAASPEATLQQPGAMSAVHAPSTQMLDMPPTVPAQAITPLPGTGLGIGGPSPQSVLSMPPQSVPMAGQQADRQNAPAVVFDASDLPVAASATAPGAPAGTTPTAASGNGNEDFAARIGGVGGSAAVAAVAVDPRTTVTQGTLIPAVLETAIDTDVPGFVRAVVSSDVRSFDGSRVLVPRSSRLIGQYRSGLQAGQKRAYVIWTRLIRPDGVAVNIASPAVGFSGETGLAGKVSSHFFERFGSAMLLSVIGGLSSIGGNAGVVIASGGQSAAAAAIGQSGQIGPTVRVRQGEPIRVFTARDLDFSRVDRE